MAQSSRVLHFFGFKSGGEFVASLLEEKSVFGTALTQCLVQPILDGFAFHLNLKIYMQSLNHPNLFHLQYATVRGISSCCSKVHGLFFEGTCADSPLSIHKTLAFDL